MTAYGKPDTALPIYTEGALTGACWSCGDMRAAHFCESCGKLQPAKPTDYFTFFGLPRKLDIDVAELEREFHRLSRKLHPDVYATTASKEQQWSLEKSSQLNDAYRTLRDPIERTAYLLKLEGVQLEEQSKTATDQARATGQEKKQVVPPDLLEEVFELNLQLEEFKANRKLDEDDPELLRQIESAREGMEKKLASTDAELRKLWDRWDRLSSDIRSGATEPYSQEEVGGTEKQGVITEMVALLNRRTYLRNLVRDIIAALEG